MTKNTNLRLKERDYQILRLLYEFRFLSGELTWHLIKSDDHSGPTSFSIGQDGRKRPSRYGFGRQALFKRLKQLFDAGYVQRHYITDQPIGRGYGLPRAIYGLGPNAPRVLHEMDGIPVNETKKIIEGNNVKSPFLRHALEVAIFRVILKLACDNSNGKVNLLFWEQGNALKDHVYGYNGNGKKEKFTIHADAFFGIRVGNRTKHYFLEIDRGTEPIVSHSRRSNIRKKLRGYQYYHKSKKIKQKFDSNVNGFQVLIVTPGEIEKSSNLRGRIANIYNEITVNNNIYPTKSLFLLTTPLNLSLSDPKSVFLAIWVSVKIIKYLLSLLE